MLVPLAGSCTLRMISLYKVWLQTHAPDLAGLLIKPLEKYLGFFLGPGVTSHDFTGPLVKFRARTKYCGIHVGNWSGD